LFSEYTRVGICGISLVDLKFTSITKGSYALFFDVYRYQFVVEKFPDFLKVNFSRRAYTRESVTPLKGDFKMMYREFIKEN
jgi:hypothetical protein